MAEGSHEDDGQESSNKSMNPQDDPVRFCVCVCGVCTCARARARVLYLYVVCAFTCVMNERKDVEEGKGRIGIYPFVR